jgi:hypothetical protein
MRRLGKVDMHGAVKCKVFVVVKLRELPIGQALNGSDPP